MANPTARALIIDAYKTSGIKGRGQRVGDEDTSEGLRLLNFHLIDILRLQKLWSPSVSEYTFPTIANKTTYTVGFSDPIVTNPQPDIIVNQEIVQILQSQVNVGSVWVPLRQISPEDNYRMTINESITNIPSQFMYNRTRNPFDELVFSNPTLAGYNVRLAMSGEVQNYLLDDTIDLPSGYYAALMYGLAELLCDAQGFNEQAATANMKFSGALTRLKDVVGSPVPKLKLDYGNSRYNIQSDVTVNSFGGI